MGEKSFPISIYSEIYGDIFYIMPNFRITEMYGIEKSCPIPVPVYPEMYWEKIMQNFRIYRNVWEQKIIPNFCMYRN